MSNRMHIFNFFGDRWYDEESTGPLDATTYLDPETGFSGCSGESWTTQVETVVCRLEGVIPCDIPGPPSWSAYESVLPESVLPLKTRATKPAKHTTIDASWQAAW